MGVVVRRYIDFLILLIPTPLVSVLFYSSTPTFCSFLIFVLVGYNYCSIKPICDVHMCMFLLQINCLYINTEWSL